MGLAHMDMVLGACLDAHGQYGSAGAVREVGLLDVRGADTGATTTPASIAEITPTAW